MQPIKFIPLLKQTIWGGEKISALKHRHLTISNIGESWEISGVKNDETIADNEPYHGKTVNQLVAEYQEKLVGKDNYQRFGDEFPLLIKFIDARSDLSIQVHPSEEIAHQQGKPHGKTEMWYLMNSEKGAQLYSGLKKRITPEKYKAMVADDTICDALAQYKVKEGDVFFLPAGRIHAIGAGCFLAEIQQTSDVTYRIYDYKRKDKNGNYRDLHTEQAAQCIDYHTEKDYRTHYQPEKNVGITLVSCPYFTTSVYDLDEPMTIEYKDLDSFVILIGLSGNGSFTDNEGNTFTLQAGETVLIPASTEEIHCDGALKFLETFV
ncbi:MAG: class I mannose-6-phosphate isomerase [Prevotella sp.]|nr:class I mannose-6-phosphate isomerase [Prevotella sp.]